jgi:hypothetical protein
MEETMVKMFELAPRFLSLLVATTALVACAVPAGDDAEESGTQAEELRTRKTSSPRLTDSTPVSRSECASPEDVPFGRLSSYEQRVLRNAFDLYVGTDGTSKIGCGVTGGGTGVYCEAFGYVCWYDPDLPDSAGCSKQTC